MERDEIIATIRAAPDAVQAICAPLSDEQLRRRPADAAKAGEAGWSLIEIICHLRDSAQEDGLRIRRMVEEDNPTLVPYDEAEWARERDYQGADPAKAPTAMRAMVSGLAYQIENLSDDQWSRGGNHPERGPLTVESSAIHCAEHLRDHLAQMGEAMEAS